MRDEERAAALAFAEKALPPGFRPDDVPGLGDLLLRCADEWWTAERFREELARDPQFRRWLDGQLQMRRMAAAYQAEGVEPFSCSSWRLLSLRLFRRRR